MLDRIGTRLAVESHETAVALAALPEQIRGFGPLKHAAVEKAEARKKELLAALEMPARRKAAA
jgi:indolepyruvate ferredoxin oxidoreductase